MKYRSTKRAKALEIPQEVKDAVFERDKGCCVWCGRHGPYVLPEAHFIPRSKGGLGIEENVLTLCRYTCHREYDQGDKRKRDLMRDWFVEYLKTKYPGWDETKMIYRKDGM